MRAVTICIAAFPPRLPGAYWNRPTTIWRHFPARSLFRTTRLRSRLSDRPIGHRRRLQAAYRGLARVDARHLPDPATGLIRPWVDSEGKGHGPPRDSYAAWTIHYLNWVDRNLAQEQYRLLKTNFAVKLPLRLAALRAYPRGYNRPADVDSGPVIFGLSTSGTGFMIAGARICNDADYLQSLLSSVEAAGSTVGAGGARHTLFGPVAGEAILQSGWKIRAGKAVKAVGGG